MNDNIFEPVAHQPVSLRQLIAFSAMVAGMFLSLLDIQIVSSSLTNIQAGLSASSQEISWIQTSYLMAEVIMIPLSGFLSRMMSTRLLFSLSAAGFTVASMLCATATSIEQMIIYRTLQGFLGGGMIPSVFATGFIIFPLSQRAIMATYVGLVATIAPTIGPTLGGFITHYISWNWLFWINIFPGIIITIISWKLIDFDRPDWSLMKRFDWVGMLYMAVSLGSLQYILEEGPRHDWFEDTTITFFFFVMLVSAIGFFWQFSIVEQPIVDLKAFCNRNFSLGALFSFILGIGLYGLIYLYPLYLSQIRYYDSLMIGQTMFVAGLFMLITAPLVGFLINRMDQRIMIAMGGVGFGLGTWLVAVGLTNEWDYWELFLPQALRGIFAVMSIVPISNIALGTLSPHTVKNASALFNLMRNLGGAVGLAIINTMIMRTTDKHYAYLSETLDWGDKEALELLETLSLLMESQRGHTETTSLQQLSNMVHNQAMILALIDVFSFLTILFFILTVMVVLVKK